MSSTSASARHRMSRDGKLWTASHRSLICSREIESSFQLRVVHAHIDRISRTALRVCGGGNSISVPASLAGHDVISLSPRAVLVCGSHRGNFLELLRLGLPYIAAGFSSKEFNSRRLPAERSTEDCFL